MQWFFLNGQFEGDIIFCHLNTLRPRQDGRHLPDDIFKCISLNENVWISIEIKLKFVSKGSINNIPALVQIMAWRRPGDKPLSGPMIIRLPTHIYVTRPQWLKLSVLSNNSWRTRTVTSNHLPRPHRESPWGDEKLSDTLTAEAGRKWKMLNFEIFPQWHHANLTAYQRL